MQHIIFFFLFAFSPFPSLFHFFTLVFVFFCSFLWPNLSYVLFSSSRLQRADKRSSLSGARQRRGSWNYGLRKWRRRSRFSRLASRLCRQTMTSPMRGSLPCRVQTHAHTHTSIHVALHRLGRLIQSYGCVNQSLIPKCNKSNWTATSHSGGAQS